MPENGSRDNASREATLNRLREALGDDVGRGDAGAFDGRINSVETGYGRDRDRPHQQQVGFDEFGKVKELNSEFLDSKLESYLTQTLDTERDNQERKYGRGFLGRARRWLEETPVGKTLKCAGKVALGGLCLAGTAGTGGLAAPLLMGLGTSLLLDSVAEMGQYGFEFPRLNALRQGRADRMQMVLRAMEIRNSLHDEADSMTHVANPAMVPGATGDLRTELGTIITQLNEIDQNIINEEQQLARVRMWGNGIRAGLKLGSAVGGIAYGMAHGGIALGHMAVNGPGHDVFLGAKHFLSFARTSGEIYAAHLAGNSLPLAFGAVGGANAALYAAGLGTAGALALNAGMSVNESLRNRGFARNPKGTGVFSLRGRTELGNAENEISLGSLPAETDVAPEDKESKIRENKAGMESVGSIWRWTRAGSAELFISKGFSADGDLKFATFDPTTGTETGNFIYPANGVDVPFLTATRLANNFDAYKESSKIDEAVKRAAEERGVAIPKNGELWVPGSPFDVVIGAATINISVDERIRINDIRDHSREVYIRVLDSAGDPVPGKEGWTSTEQIIRNSKMPESKEKKKGGKEEYKEQFESIQEILASKGIRSEIKEKKVLKIGDEWLHIASVDSAGGYMMVQKTTSATPVTAADLKKPVEEELTFEKLIEDLNTAVAAGTDIKMMGVSAGGSTKK